MKRWSATLLVLAVCAAVGDVVHADVTIVQKTTAEGGMATMAQAQGGVPTPTITTRIKGSKGRTDVELNSPMFPGQVSTITDGDSKQVIMLDHNQKTARVSTGAAAPAPNAPMPTVNIEGAVTPTGQTQTIDGMKCEEYTLTTSIDLSSMGGGQMPPGAMQGVTMVMKGSMWVARDAPGAADYAAYQKAMTAADLLGASMGATGVSLPGMEKMAKAMAAVPGLPVLTEMTMSVEGQGQMADMMRQMGAMKVTTRVTSVKTDAIADDAFKVPEGYQVIK